MERVLAIEDCEDQQRLIVRALEGEFRVETAGSLAAARREMECHLPDIVLLDVELPDGDGFRFCSELQEHPRTRGTPVVFLTGRGEGADKVMAFSLGADDYLEKPFDPLELRARVRARLRGAGRAADVLRSGALELEPAFHRAFAVDAAGRRRELGLTAKEFRLLHLLARHEGRVFTRGQLLEQVWGPTIVSERTVDSHLSNLRRKLAELGHRLEAVRGAGYRLVRGPARTP